MLLNQLLNQTVARSIEIEAIFIVNLEMATTEYINSDLQEDNPELYTKLVGEYGISMAVNQFINLKSVPKALSIFGEETQLGNLQLSIFYLKERLMIISFIGLDDIDFAICYLSRYEALTSNLIIEFQNSIQEVKDKFIQELL